MPDPLIAPLVADSPLRALLRMRLSTRTDAALVFVTPGGVYRHAVPRPHRGRASGRGVRVGQVLARSFAQVYRVRMAEQALSFSVRLPCGDERAGVAADLQLVARVHDPALVVEQRIIDPEPYVRANIQAQMADITIQHSVDTLPEAERQIAQVLARAEPFRLPELGMSYGPGHVRLRLEGGPLGGPSGDSRRGFAPVTTAAYDGTADLGGPVESDPAPWMQLRRQELDFYKDLVQDGPRSLIAFWLREHPESIKEIVEWVSAHQPAGESSRKGHHQVEESPARAEIEDTGPASSAGPSHAATPHGADVEAELQQAMTSILSRGGYTAEELRHLVGQLGPPKAAPVQGPSPSEPRNGTGGRHGYRPDEGDAGDRGTT